MNKITSDENEKENKFSILKRLRKLLLKIIFLVLIITAGYFIWKNFDSIKERISNFYDKDEEITEISISPDWATLIEEKADKALLQDLQEKVINLQTVTGELMLAQSNTQNMATLNERVDNMKDLLIASVNGKADAQALLGLIVRVDKLENELNRLSHLNNEGAIMLSAVMLIKENAMDGKNFAFEAAMLSEIAGNNHKIAEPLKVIEEAAQNGIATNTELSQEFSKIYADFDNKREGGRTEQNWKDRLNSKINELITINKSEEQIAESDESKFMKAVLKLADEQKFVQVVNLINNSNNNYLKEDADLQNWMKKVLLKQNFESAISKISSYCLVLMKINNLLTKEQ